MAPGRVCECWTGASHQPSQGSSTPAQGPHTEITPAGRAMPAPRAVTDAPVTPSNNLAWPPSACASAMRSTASCGRWGSPTRPRSAPSMPADLHPGIRRPGDLPGRHHPADQRRVRAPHVGLLRRPVPRRVPPPRPARPAVGPQLHRRPVPVRYPYLPGRPQRPTTIRTRALGLTQSSRPPPDNRR